MITATKNGWMTINTILHWIEISMRPIPISVNLRTGESTGKRLISLDSYRPHLSAAVR